MVFDLKALDASKDDEWRAHPSHVVFAISAVSEELIAARVIDQRGNDVRVLDLLDGEPRQLTTPIGNGGRS